MSAYGRTKRRATKKRKARSREPKKKKVSRAVSPRAPIDRGAVGGRKKPLARKRAKSSNKRSVRRKGKTAETFSKAKRQNESKKSTRKPSYAKRGSSTTRNLPRKKRAAIRKVPRKVRAATKRSVVKKPIRTLAQKRKETREKIRKLEERLNKERQKLRRKGLKGEARKRQKVRAKKVRSKLQEEVTGLPSGFPKGKLQKLKDHHEHNKKVFNELLRLATKKKRLPKFDNRKRRMKVTEKVGGGHKRGVRCDILLDEQGLEEAMYQIGQAAKSLPGIYAQWTTQFTFASMGARLVGSGIHTVRLDHPDESKFTFSYDSSGTYNDMSGMLAGAREQLEDYTSEKYSIIQLLHFTVKNYDFGLRR
jgi:hypothetical protein